MTACSEDIFCGDYFDAATAILYGYGGNTSRLLGRSLQMKKVITNGDFALILANQ